MRRSFVEELNLNASEVEIVLDYFLFGRKLFQPAEIAFVEGEGSFYKLYTLPLSHTSKIIGQQHICLIGKIQAKTILPLIPRFS